MHEYDIYEAVTSMRNRTHSIHLRKRKNIDHMNITPPLQLQRGVLAALFPFSLYILM